MDLKLIALLGCRLCSIIIEVAGGQLWFPYFASTFQNYGWRVLSRWLHWQLLFALSLATITHSIIRQQLALFAIRRFQGLQLINDTPFIFHLYLAIWQIAESSGLANGRLQQRGEGRVSKWQLQLHLPQQQQQPLQQQRKLTSMRFKMLLNYFKTMQLEFAPRLSPSPLSSPEHSSHNGATWVLAITVKCVSVEAQLCCSCNCNPFFFGSQKPV